MSSSDETSGSSDIQLPDALFSFVVQKDELLSSFNSVELKSENIGHYILESFKCAPEFIGQVDAKTGRETTFQEMRTKSIKCAIFLRNMGVKQNDVVTICIYNHIDAYVPYLACLYIRAIADLWHENYITGDIKPQKLLNLRKPKIIFTNSRFFFAFKYLTNHERIPVNIVTIDKYVQGHYFLNKIINEVDDEIDRFSCTNYYGNIKLPHVIFSYPTGGQMLEMKNNTIGMWYAPFCSLHGPFLTVRAILKQVTVIKPKKFKEKNMYKTIQKYKIKTRTLSSISNLFDVKSGNIGKYILESLKCAPDFIGQVDDETGRTTTFREMRMKSVKCAIFMAALGIMEGDVVTICIPNHVDAYAPYLACLYIGAIADLWHEDFVRFGGTTSILHILSQTKSKMIFITSMLARNFEYITHCKELKYVDIVTIDKLERDNYFLNDWISHIDDDDERVENFSCSRIGTMESAGIMYSPSATTSFKSNIGFPHMMFSYPTSQTIPDMKKNDIGMWYAPFCSLHGPFLTVRAILEQVTVIKPKTFSEENMYETIQKHKVNWMLLESKMCNKMLFNVDVSVYDTSSLREIVCDSEIRHQAYASLMTLLPHVPIIKVYSMVQTGVIACQKNSSKIRCSGYVAPIMKVIIVDANTRERLGPESRGEIWCRYPTVLPNSVNIFYEKNEEFLSEPTAKDQNRMEKGWYYTGDWGYFDKDGAIYVIDKINHLMRNKSQLISSTEIEAKIEEHPHVIEAYILTSPTDKSLDSVHIKSSPELEVFRANITFYI
ncbi:Luciferin 4-monooxygenase [Ooceraea biroi]|uniref:Luciferin 4-monooxygenase n=1 Tax=Ooceraea biroi TaxID=2015173 RepID=A0A026W4T5_OOCBI|nr:Luciferin 4-monooxygenase [Ooceraea biroi]